MDCLRIVLLYCLLAAVSATDPLEALGQKNEYLPDLNLLKQRVTGFWSLLQQRRRREALAYVEAATQNRFLNRRELPFTSFKIRNIQFENQGTVLVTLDVTIQTAFLARPLKWPVTQRYVFEEGNWFLQVQESKGKDLFRKKSSKLLALNNADDKQIAKGLRQFQIAAIRLDLGALQQGDLVWRDISYRNDSQLVVLVKITHSPSWVAFDKSEFEVGPEEKGTLRLGFFTEELEGKILGEISLTIGHGSVIREHTFAVVGQVTQAVTIVPARLIVSGSAEHEILIENNTDQELQIVRVVPSADFVEVEWDADEHGKIAPASRVFLKVQWEAEHIPADWVGGSIRLQLDESVAARKSFDILLLPQFP